MRKPTRYKTGWLVCRAQVLSSLNIADTARSRRRGLIGQREIATPLFIYSCRWIHTLGVRCSLDVAYLNDAFLVVKTQTIGPLRVAMPVFRARHVLEAEAGSFERWGLQVGHTLEVRQT